jgi:hypothetical protein
VISVGAFFVNQEIDRIQHPALLAIIVEAYFSCQNFVFLCGEGEKELLLAPLNVASRLSFRSMIPAAIHFFKAHGPPTTPAHPLPVGRACRD